MLKCLNIYLGYEHYALKNAKELFQVIDFQVVFMEWGQMPRQKVNDSINEMINFLYDHNLEPYYNETLLNRFSWYEWPWDIVWKKKIY
jgi:hypothetical protein